MRRSIMVAAFVVAWTVCAGWAQSQGAPPTQVRQIGIYGCPRHPQFQATWPARCPACGTTLSKIRLSADTDNNPFSAGGENEEQETNEGFGNQGYYPSNQYGQYGYQAPYSYPPSQQPGNQGYYPPSSPNQPYGEGQESDQYGGILSELDKLFGRNEQQSPNELQ